MDKKSATHDKIMTFLDRYLKETPKHILQKEVEEISRMKFSGASARDYFLNFNKYYNRQFAEVENSKKKSKQVTSDSDHVALARKGKVKKSRLATSSVRKYNHYTELTSFKAMNDISISQQSAFQNIGKKYNYV